MTAAVPVRTPLPSALAGQTVVIVGGSSGIGLAAGALLAGIGARAVLVGRDKDRLDAAVSTVRQAIGVAANVTDEEALAGIFDQAGEVHHVLVTAGGVSGAGTVAQATAEDLMTAYRDRVWGAFAVARTAATRLPAGGSITLTSGTMLARPQPGMAGPLAAVGGVETLTRALAVELAPERLRVNAVRYGAFDTPLLRGMAGLDTDEAVARAGATTPLGRYGTAEEAAASTLFLMSNPYMTGQVITIDGGQSLA
ncbi:MAG: SDR family oxidoreductase [Nonomuraea sp.]|nr:SDR family oxidoreductase [Nonomuraea sp.]